MRSYIAHKNILTYFHKKMSYSHLTNPANTDKQNLYVNDVDIAGDVVIDGGFEIDGLLETKGGISASGTATLPAIAATANITPGITSTTATAQPAAQFTGNNATNIVNITQSGAGAVVSASGGDINLTNGNVSITKNNASNAVLSLSAPNTNAAAVNFTIGGVLCGTLASDVNGITLSGALSDPTFDVNLVVSGANKILASSSYSYNSTALDLKDGPGPLVSNTRVGYLRFTAIPSVAAGNETALTWTNSLATIGSQVRVSVLQTTAAAQSCFTYKGCVPSAGSLELVFLNGGSAATGAGGVLWILAEIIN